MGPIFLIAIAAAAASALLAAGAATGAMLAVPLFYLAPLPVMIVGVAFSPLAALIAAIAAAVGLGLAFSGTFLIAYVVVIGAPAFALAYAALLAQPEPGAPERLAWFPVGQLVLLAAAAATLGVWVALLTMATDYESYRTAIGAALKILLDSPEGPASPHDQEAAATLVAHVLPPMAGLTTMVSQLGCLYLAGRAARISQRLARPWPDLGALHLPRITGFALAAALVLTLPGGMIGLLASVAAATLLLAYALIGFAVVHTITLGHGARPLILAGLWLTAVVLGWPVLAMALLGFADALFDFRSRIGSGQAPPAANDR